MIKKTLLLIYPLAILVMFLLLTNSCKKDENNNPTVSVPVLTTSAVISITPPTANCGGSITSDGGSTITYSGVCWSTNPFPTIADSTTKNSLDNGSFKSVITGLLPNTNYNVRAYATNNTGTGYGNQVSFNSGYIMGLNFAGGFVFYNDGNAHGLVSAASDQSKGAAWGCTGTTITGADGTAIGTGKQNTIDILLGCSASGIAARLCDDLVSGGYDDWYLPSLLELNLMFVNLHTAGLGGFTNAIYWSSSEIDSNRANGLPFYCGYLLNNNKSTTYFVRAVRAF
jgi:hypothetical protein